MASSASDVELSSTYIPSWHNLKKCKQFLFSQQFTFQTKLMNDPKHRWRTVRGATIVNINTDAWRQNKCQNKQEEEEEAV